MAENKVNKPSLPTDKPDIDKKDENSKNVVGVEKVAKSNPEMILSNSRTKKLIITLVSLILCVILATALIFIVKPKTWSPVDINIEFDVDANIQIEEDSQGNKKALLPGDSLKSTFSVKSTATEGSNAEVFVRVMFYAEVDNNFDSNVFVFDTSSVEWSKNWIMGADGYAYLRKTLKANQQIEFLNNIILNKNLDNSYQGKTITVVFRGECLQAGEEGFSAIESIWRTAPTLWKNEFNQKEA